MSESKFYVITAGTESFDSADAAIVAAKAMLTDQSLGDPAGGAYVVAKAVAELKFERVPVVERISYPRARKSSPAAPTATPVPAPLSSAIITLPTAATAPTVTADDIEVPLDARCFVDNKVAVKGVMTVDGVRYLCVDHASNQ